LAGRLREAIRLLVRRTGVLQKAEASCCGITLAQCHALIEIGRSGELSLNDLAGRLNLDKSTASRTVEGLASCGLVEREINPENRRSVAIRLTGKGMASCRAIEEKMDSYFGKVLGAIPADKRQQVVESLEMLLKVLEDEKCC
jgi:DNA-binding MarR family transcriptional regulator